MTPKELREHCIGLPGASEEFPFNPATSVFKVAGKIFAIAPLEAEPLSVSVKAEPEIAESLRDAHGSIVPGYHLNKRHWVTVTLGGDAGDDLVRDLIVDSYDLVRPRSPGA
jgi:predicted DNA-binding protein (MmcQ/YjbR family)